MNRKQIIMNFSVPPSCSDLKVIGEETLEILPEEILEFCDELTIEVEDFPDEVIEDEFDLDDPYDLLAFYKSGKEIAPGVERKVAEEGDVLILYRRSILDLWCENEEDLAHVVRQVMIEELGRHLDFSDDEIEEMIERHYQGLFE